MKKGQPPKDSRTRIYGRVWVIGSTGGPIRCISPIVNKAEGRRMLEAFGMLHSLMGWRVELSQLGLELKLCLPGQVEEFHWISEASLAGARGRHQ